jgi:monovalent cation:H+ antiporter-2, CPA2 family
VIAVLAAEAGSPEAALLFVELGAVVLGLAMLGRLAGRVGLSPIPLYLLAGLAFGEGGLYPLDLSSDFIAVASEIGVVLLLFLLGLEYTPEELTHGLRGNLRPGVVDLLASGLPGLAVGLLLGWDLASAVALAGVNYMSSSGVIAKVLAELGRLGNRETPTVLSLLVLEDLVMAAFLPILGILLRGPGPLEALASLALSIGTVALVLLLALRFGDAISRVIAVRSDEVLLLTVLGLVLLVAGIAQQLQVSSAVGAFLVGIAVSGQVAERARDLLTPLQDLFAAVFFVFFGLQVDPGGLPDVALLATGLAVVTAATKFATAWWATRRAGIGPAGRIRAGTVFTARGEFSIVIAGLAVTAGLAEVGPVATAYVLLLAVAGPVLTRVVEPLGARFLPAPTGG